jgi:hypothetical protein
VTDPTSIFFAASAKAAPIHASAAANRNTAQLFDSAFASPGSSVAVTKKKTSSSTSTPMTATSKPKSKPKSNPADPFGDLVTF